MSKIYENRYQAKKDARYGQVIVKVDAGGGKIGYRLMDAAEYRVWRKQK
jgi:predicted GNAT family N-acyltransferase